MSEWKTEALGKIARTTSGGTPDKKHPEYYGGSIPWVRSGELDKGLITDTEIKITQAGLDNSSAKIFPEGTLLIALYGATIGKIAFLGIPAATNQAVCTIFENEKVSLKYLYYFLLFKRPDLIKQGVGGAQPNISQAILKRLPVHYPTSLTEQQRIVARIEELFSQLDSGVETLRKTKQQLAVYRQAVLKEAFNPKQDWKFAMASEIGEVCLGRQRSPDNISNLYPTKYIRAANITESGIDAHDVLEMEFTPAERDKYYLRYNDIVISEASGSKTQVGKPALWKGEIENCCFQNTVIRHRVEHQNPTFIFWQYKFLYLSGYFAREVGGVGINHIGAKNFSRIRLAIAPIGKQNAIVEKIESQLSVCDSIEQTVDAALQQAEALRQSILKQAFEEG